MCSAVGGPGEKRTAGGPSGPGAETVSTLLGALLRAYRITNAFTVSLLICITSEERPIGAQGERLPGRPPRAGAETARGRGGRYMPLNEKRTLVLSL